MNRLGRTLALTLLVAVVGCGGSSESDLESAVHQDLQADIDASGRKVVSVDCPAERQPICIARLTTKTGDHFAAVKYAGSGADATVVNHIDQGVVQKGPLEEGLKRDLEPELNSKVTKVECNRERYECHAWGEDGRGIVVVVQFDDSDDYSIVTTVGN